MTGNSAIQQREQTFRCANCERMYLQMRELEARFEALLKVATDAKALLPPPPIIIKRGEL